MVITTRTRPDRSGAVESTIRDYLNTLFYYRKIALAVFLCVAAIGTIIALALPMPYKAEATLLVLQAGYYDQSNSVAGGAVTQPAIGQLVSVESQILSSPELHRDVVVSESGDKSNTHAIAPLVQQFEKRFHLEQNDLANTVELSYLDNDPQRAADVLNRLLTQYFRQRATIFTSGRVDFLVGQRDEVGAQLEKLDARLLELQKTHGIVNIDDQISRAVALESLLVQRKLENDAALTQDRKALESLRAATRGVQPNIALFTDNAEVAHALATLQISLAQLEARRSDFASRYMASSPFVQQLDQQIADMRASIARHKQQLVNTTRSGHNTYYDVVQDRLVSLMSGIAGESARQSELQGQVDDIRSRLQSLIDVSSQLRELQGRRDILVDSLRDRSRQVDLASIQQGQVSQVNSTNVRVIQAPVPPSQRILSPGLLIAASLLAGLVVSALSVLILASLRETFLSPEQVERALMLPVLSAPVMLTRSTRQFWRRSTLGAPDACKIPIDRVARLPMRTGYGRMIAAINGSSHASSKVVMAVSFGRNDGMSSVIQGLAVELEQRCVKPVLILDLVSTPQQSLYGSPDANGRLNWENEGAGSDSISDSPAGNAPGQEQLVLWRVNQRRVVVAQLKDKSSSASWRGASGLLDALRQSYDYIVVHTPPVSDSFAGIEHAALADATLLVIRAEVTRRPVALDLKTQLEDAGANIIGMALTHRQGYIPNFVYRLFLMH